MKKYIPLLALSALTFCSCSGFLNVQPEGNPATTSYFLNDEQGDGKKRAYSDLWRL